MLFKDLYRLRPDKDDETHIPTETLRMLQLPMPEAVFTQLVVDHALTPFTQECYGNLDLNALEWDELSLTGAEIVTTAVQNRSEYEMNILTGQVEKVNGDNWKGVALSPKNKKLWKENKTWLNSPLFVRGDVCGDGANLLLVEGHRRLATLRGLVKSGWLPSDSTHKIWVGRLKEPPYAEGPWKQVVRENPVPFYIWLSKQGAGDDEVGKICNAISEQRECWYFMDENAEDVLKVYKIVNEHAELSQYLDILRTLEEMWRHYTNP